MIRNSEQGYGVIAIAIHWIMALAIFFLFGLGLYMVELTYYDTWYKGSLDLHKSIGITLFAFWILRLVWRWTNVEPTPEPGQRWEHFAAHAAHIVLYLLMLALMITGYLISTATGAGIELFGLFDIPALPWAFENQEDTMGYVHWLLAWGLMGVVAVHAMAAMKHHYINKDNTLIRMLRSRKSI